MKQKDEFYWRYANHVTDFQRFLLDCLAMETVRNFYENSTTYRATPVLLSEIAKRRNSSFFFFSVLEKVYFFLVLNFSLVFVLHTQFLSEEKVEDAIMVLVINTSVYKILSSFCFKGSLKIVRRRILRATFA